MTVSGPQLISLSFAIMLILIFVLTVLLYRMEMNEGFCENMSMDN